jgi:hypothetical protein
MAFTLAVHVRATVPGRAALAAALVAGLFAGQVAVPVLAQSIPDEPSFSQPDDPEPPDLPGPIDLTTTSTATVATELAQANDTCGDKVDSRYKIDCLRQSYLKLARAIPRGSDYEPVKAALIDAAAKLDRIVTDNLDPAAPTIRPRDRGKDRTPRLPPVRAVAPERLAAANAAAAAVVQETGLLILRSGRDPKRRNVHYQEIAAAVDSNIVLLRSS